MNKHTTQTTSTLLRNKLGVVASRLQSSALPDGTRLNYDTMEEVVAEATSILSRFYKYLSVPSFNPVEVRADTIPYPDMFNNHFSQVLDDLTVLFAEFENLEGVVVGEFNYMVSRLNRLNRKLKSASSQLADYILFANIPTKDVIFFSDSFNNLSRIESESPLLNEEQCEVNQVEGIVTLPVDRSAQVAISIQALPVINSNSNGTVGNNQEVGAVFHGSISDILDNNADTWFEYERVVSTDDGEALTLDITINMDKVRIINFVRVNPNNFGTRTQVKILSIDTSIDGNEFISIKDDIPIADFTTEDEENVFTLAPSTSKYAGQGLYTFTPRKAKYVHLTFRQSTPYMITTTSGIDKFRYAIGIRDVDIQALPYKSKGEVISSEYSVSDEIRKLVLLSNQNPTAGTVSALADIIHAVSPDNGVTWHQIRPRSSSGVAGTQQTSFELLDFNGVSKNTVNTNTPVNSLRYRATLKRNTEAFSQDPSDLAQVVADATELHPFPTQAPFRINLSRQPIDGTIRVIDPSFGSRGFDDSEYGIALGTGNKKIVRIPFAPLRKDFEKSGSPNTVIDHIDPQTIYVDGEEWTRGALTGTSKNYKLNFQEGIIEFGDGTDGAVVLDKSLISMKLSEERLFFQKGKTHTAQLDYPTANDKEQITITIYHPVETKTVVLDKGKKIHYLDPLIQTSPTPVFSDTVVFTTEETSEEDMVAGGGGHYYIDYTNGVLMSISRTKNTQDTTLTYVYQPATVLTVDDWDFTDIDGGIANGVVISNDIFQSFEVSDESVNSSRIYFNLDNLSVVPGSVEFSGGSSFTKEVEFIDGRTELLENVRVEQQLEPMSVSGSTILSIPFDVKVVNDTDFRVMFSNSTVFATEQVNYAAVVAGGNGSYFVDRTGGTTGIIYVKTATSYTDPGKVVYYYANPQANLTGRYSINYETGEVYCYTATTTGITVSYLYTDIRAKYHIAREIGSTDWEYSKEDKTISIADREILKSGRTFHTNNPSTSSASRYYQITYKYMKDNRAAVQELEPYFSPVLKDYALKIYTKSRLV